MDLDSQSLEDQLESYRSMLAAKEFIADQYWRNNLELRRQIYYLTHPLLNLRIILFKLAVRLMSRD
jgi:hypothetical protein